MRRGWGPMAAWSALLPSPRADRASSWRSRHPSVRPCGVKPPAAELEQIQALNRFKKVVIYWLDLIKYIIYCEPNRCTLMQICPS